jgi:hypothetical protein
MRNLCTVLTALFFVDRAPTWYGDFFMKITEASIVMSSAFHSSHASSDARVQKQYDEWVARVLKSRVKFAAGSDMCWFSPGTTRAEASAATLLNLRAAGMPPLDFIRAITVNAAEMLGWQDRDGSNRAREICRSCCRWGRADRRYHGDRASSIWDEGRPGRRE